MKKPFVLIAAIVAVVGLGAAVAVAKAPTAPLTLGARAHQEPGGSLRVYAYTNHDSTIVVSGRKIKKTKKATEPLPPEAVRYWASIRVRPKHPSRVDRPGWLRAKIKVAATDEFGQRATVEIEKRFSLLPRP